MQINSKSRLAFLRLLSDRWCAVENIIREELHMKTHNIRAKELVNGWIDGTINGFCFKAKIVDKSTRYGIENGRIIKLLVLDKSTRFGIEGRRIIKRVVLDKHMRTLEQYLCPIISYDRGWDISPSSSEHEEILKALLEYFKNYPTIKY